MRVSVFSLAVVVADGGTRQRSKHKVVLPKLIHDLGWGISDGEATWPRIRFANQYCVLTYEFILSIKRSF